jgi:hypothetical protein
VVVFVYIYKSNSNVGSWKCKCVLSRLFHGDLISSKSCNSVILIIICRSGNIPEVVHATNICGWQLICNCFLCSTPDPDNVLIVKTPEGVFSTKFFLQNGEKQTAARLVRKENHQEKVLPPIISDCLVAKCLTYEMSKYKVVFLHLLIVFNCLHSYFFRKGSTYCHGWILNSF